MSSRNAWSLETMASNVLPYQVPKIVDITNIGCLNTTNCPNKSIILQSFFWVFWPHQKPTSIYNSTPTSPSPYDSSCSGWCHQLVNHSLFLGSSAQDGSQPWSSGEHPSKHHRVCESILRVYIYNNFKILYINLFTNLRCVCIFICKYSCLYKQHVLNTLKHILYPSLHHRFKRPRPPSPPAPAPAAAAPAFDAGHGWGPAMRTLAEQCQAIGR